MFKKFPLSQKKIEKSVKKNWLGPGYTINYIISLDITDNDFLDFLKEFLKIAQELGIFKNEILDNIQGREDQETKFLSFNEFKVDSDHKELFLAEGIINNLENKDEESDSEPERFFIRYTSKFKEFKGNHHIINSVIKKSSSNIDYNIDIQEFLNQKNIEIDFFRFGFEFFKSKSFTSIFGFVPVVIEGLYVEAKKNQIILNTWTERANSKNDTPLERFKIIDIILNS